MKSFFEKLNINEDNCLLLLVKNTLKINNELHYITELFGNKKLIDVKFENDLFNPKTKIITFYSTENFLMFDMENHPKNIYCGFRLNLIGTKYC